MIQSYIIEVPGFGILDTYNSLDVSFNYAFQDLGDINSTVVEFSKSVPLPGTPNNNLFFQQKFELSVTDSYNANKRVRCNVRIGDTNIFKGFIKLERIVRDLEAVEYEITILSITKNLTEEIGDSALTDLDFTEWNHNRNVDGIVASWDNYIYRNGSQTSFDLGKGYVYPKIIYGNSTDIGDRWYTYDAFPAMYVKTVWDKIFESYGYTYTSTFLESEYFKRLIIPFNREQLTLNVEAEASRSLKAGIDNATLPGENSGSALPYTFKMSNAPAGSNPLWVEAYSYNWPGLDDESTLDFNDPSNQWDGGMFTCGKQGWYDVNFSGQLHMRYEGPMGPGGPYVGNVQFTSGELYYYYEMYLQKSGSAVSTIIADSGRDDTNPYGLLTFAPSDNAIHVSPWDDYATPLTFNLVASHTYMEPGDKVFMRIKFRQPASNVWGGITPIVTAKPMLVRSIDGNYTTMTVTPTTSILMGDEEVNMQQVVPTMKTKDFMEGLIQMFGLSFNIDPDNETNLIIEPYEIYLKSRQKVKDWSYVLDRETFELEPTANLTAKRYIYRYDLDSDYYNEKYDAAYNETYGQLEVVTDNEFNIKDDVLTLPFASTPDAQAFNQANIVQPWLVQFDDENRMKPVSTKPRILFYGGLQWGDYIKVMDFPDDTYYVGGNQYPYAGHWDHPTNPRWDLNWGAPEQIYWNTTLYPTNNLFNQFHKNRLETIISEDGMVLTGRFKLTPNDVADIDARDIIYIDGTYWRILNINNYNPIGYDKLTEVELIKIIDWEKYQTLVGNTPTISNSCPVDLAVRLTKRGTMYVSPSGETITENCCNSLGGTYLNGSCFVGIGNSGGLNPVGNVLTSISDPHISLTNNNAVNAVNVLVNGASNHVATSTKSTIILGDANGTANVKSSLLVGDNNVATSTRNNLIVGDTNTIGSNTSTSIVIGNNNTVAEDISNVVVFGNNITAVSSSTTYVDNLNVSGSLNGIAISTILSASAGATPPLDQVLIAGSGSGTNWISIEPGYGLTSYDAGNDYTDVLVLDPTGAVVTGITSTNNTTGESTAIVASPTNATIGVSGLTYTGQIDVLESTLSLTITDGTVANNSSQTFTPGAITHVYGPVDRRTIGTSDTTTNNTPTALYTYTPGDGVYSVKCIVSGINSATTEGYTSELNASFRVVSSVVTQIATTDTNERTEFTTATSALYTDGTDIILEVTGEAATTINWKASLEFNK